MNSNTLCKFSTEQMQIIIITNRFNIHHAHTNVRLYSFQFKTISFVSAKKKLFTRAQTLWDIAHTCSVSNVFKISNHTPLYNVSRIPTTICIENQSIQHIGNTTIILILLQICAPTKKTHTYTVCRNWTEIHLTVN